MDMDNFIPNDRTTVVIPWWMDCRAKWQTNYYTMMIAVARLQLRIIKGSK